VASNGKTDARCTGRPGVEIISRRPGSPVREKEKTGASQKMLNLSLKYKVCQHRMWRLLQFVIRV
jgi:hypothetical protein